MERLYVQDHGTHSYGFGLKALWISSDALQITIEQQQLNEEATNQTNSQKHRLASQRTIIVHTRMQSSHTSVIIIINDKNYNKNNNNN